MKGLTLAEGGELLAGRGGGWWVGGGVSERRPEGKVINQHRIVKYLTAHHGNRFKGTVETLTVFSPSNAD